MSATTLSHNRLDGETSPYLLQHKDNPVHWWAWSDEAFAEARASQRPILLSVGYSACHWCHVMAHECFEDETIAATMNSGFVNIKVDREERPDVDAIYQKALALMGEQGGWPLTMFITPDGKPFFGGTYFPPYRAYGRPSFPQVLAHIGRVWGERRNELATHGDQLIAAIGQPHHERLRDGLSLALLDGAAHRLIDYVDLSSGGMNGAPKFPMPFVFEFLWRGFLRTGDERMFTAVMVTLTHLCEGGIYDHIGGGFARYATDAEWLVPHFEKMLYDNAQLVDLLTLVWQHARTPLFAERVAETIDWLTREMMGENGAFAASFDADSEGEEGKYYVWTADEIDALLGDNAALFKKVYDVTPLGNWEGHVILNRTARIGQALTPEEEDRLGPARAALLEARSKRVPPGRDDKVLADWNGLAIAAIARAGTAFGKSAWVDLAANVFKRICDTMIWRDDAGRERLGHSLCRGRVQKVAMLDDYANMANAALALYAATGEAQYLRRAEGWVAIADALYWDADGDGYFFTAADAGDLVLRTKTANDSAVPSGNGGMAFALARLFYLTGKPSYRMRAAATIRALEVEAMKSFPHGTTLLNAYELLETALQVVIRGRRGAPDTAALLDALNSVSLPNLLLDVLAPDAPLPEGHPAQGKSAVNGAATAYVCRGPVCSAPATSAEALRLALTPAR